MLLRVYCLTGCTIVEGFSVRLTVFSQYELRICFLQVREREQQLRN